eukprot:m.483516 g.483516  ORF g.483516 m.483516 type:complete len:1538 (-) comp22974_c0_seq1:121-4734(-)
MRVVAAVCLALLVSLVLLDSASSSSSHFQPGDWHDTIAVELRHLNPEAAAMKADRLAHAHGLRNLGRVGSLDNVFLFEHQPNASQPCLSRTRRSDDHHTALLASEHVHWVEQQRVLHRPRRDITIKDPLYKNQWHLHGNDGHHINAQGAWTQGVTGKGIVVTVVDDGIEWDHPDLKDNYEPRASTDLNGHDDDPYPRESDPINKHGTRCSGEIAAGKNSVCGVGVAFDAKVGAVRMLDGVVTDAVEGGSLGLNVGFIDIYTNSWGPNDSGRTMEGPAKLAEASFSKGIKEGRGGKGAIYIFASGNGGRYGDNCNADGYANHKYVISIGAVSKRHQSPWYVEPCASALAVTYSSGSGGDPAITTTDLHKRCTSSHSGTSAAAPIAAGIYALVLSANPDLTWRDVKHLTVRSAQIVAPSDDGWYTTAAGHKVHHRFAFGKLDAGKIVTMAKTWKNVPAQIVETTVMRKVNKQVPHGVKPSDPALVDTIALTQEDTKIRKLEFVQIYVNAACAARGDLVVELICPSGTPSTLLTRRSYDKATSLVWTFMTSRCWDETAVGAWKLRLRNEASTTRTAELKEWSLTLYGTSGESKECPTGTFLDHTGDCEPCDELCGSDGCTGPGSHKCVGCRYHSAGDACVKSCADVGMFGDEVECQACHEECLGGCHGPLASDCEACAHERELIDGVETCVAQCSDNEYADEQDECQPCDPECQGCDGPGPASCKACTHLEYLSPDDDPSPVDNDSGTHSQVGFSGHHRCVATCPTGTYSDGSACKPCDPECADGCHGPTPYQCESCAHLKLDISHADVDGDIECVSECPASFVPDNSGMCVCPANTFQRNANGPCEACPSECADGGCSADYASVQTCTNGCANLRHGDNCVAACPIGTFEPPVERDQATRRQCEICDSNCQSGCHGPGSDDCDSCMGLSEGGRCVEECSPNHTPNDEHECVPCSDECDPTEGCTGPGPEECVMCLHVRDQGVCVPECGPGTYTVAAVQACATCHPECAGPCFGSDNSQCFESKDQAAKPGVLPQCKSVVNGNDCEEKCPLRTFVDTSTFEGHAVCTPCHEQCDSTCKGPTASVSDCSGLCAGFQYGGMCVEACPADEPNVVADTVAMVCRTCDASCGARGCTGEGPEACLTCDGECAPGQHFDDACVCQDTACKAGEVTDGVRCLPECPVGKYADANGVCRTCDAECAEGCTAAGPTGCFSCRNLVLVDGDTSTCVGQCPQNTFVNAQDACQECDAECKGCDGPGPANCLTCRNRQLAVQDDPNAQWPCVAACPENTFEMDLGVCVPCHEQCRGGCHDRTPSTCGSCANARLAGVCVAQCAANQFEDDSGECQPCHAECAAGCSGAGPNDCSGNTQPKGKGTTSAPAEGTATKSNNNKACTHVALEDGTCVRSCPPTTYKDKSSHVCRPCHGSCSKVLGCSGPAKTDCTKRVGPEPSTVTTTATHGSHTVRLHPTAGPLKNSDDEQDVSGVVVGVLLALLLVGGIFFWKGDSVLRAVGLRSNSVTVTSRYSALANDEDDADRSHRLTIQ